jgi:muconate cycloisomerase
MKVRAAAILTISIPFRFVFEHAAAAREVSESVLVRLEDQEGRVGFGECAPREYVSGETPRSVRAALATHLLPAFCPRSFAAFAELVEALRSEHRALARSEHAAFCALELAFLDLAGKVFDCSAGEALGPIARPEVHYSGVVSAGSPAAAMKTCEAIRAHGFRSVKLKVGTDPQADREIVAGARDLLGPDCSLRVDANGAWKAEEALRRIEALVPYRLDGVEQPLAADDLPGLAWLAARSPVPVIVDESLVSIADARRLAEARACHLFNIRISKCGGLLNAARIRDLAAERGIGALLGAQVGETAILSAAGRQFATRVPDLLHHEGSYGTLLLEEDIGREDLTLGPGGRAPALAGAGLGVEVDEARLAPHIAGRQELVIR